MSTAHGPTGDRTRRARYEPLSATKIAPGMFEVRNLRSGGEYVVDVRDGACECEDDLYRNMRCKHRRFIEQVAEGELCPECGYPTCRPSCPNNHNGGDR